MENIRTRLATLLFLFLLIFQQIAHTQSEVVSAMTQKSNIATTTEIYGNTIKKKSTSDNSNNLREKRQLGYYPYGYGFYRRRPIPIIVGGFGIGAPIFGRPGFGGRGFGFGRPAFGGRGFGFGRPGFGGRGFGGRGFGGRGFGGFGGRGFGGFGGRGFGGGRGGRG